MNGYTKVAEPTKDFRDWDIEPETSFGDVDANGLPFYVWRENADNRLTFARPRYCCIVERDRELYFAFFNPSENVKSTRAMMTFAVVAGLVALKVIGTAWLDDRPPLPYHLDESDPPLLVLLNAVFKGSVLGGLAAGACYSITTFYRWVHGRFPGEGQLHTKPLRALTGFNMVQAAEAGAMINGSPAKVGRGLTAAFEDGTIMILTGNAWNYPSIAGMHRDLTNAFRVPRDDILQKWTALQKSDPPPLTPRPAKNVGVPDTL